MPGWDGNGNFSRIYSWVADAAAGIKILASRMDADTNNITNNGFGNCLTRDGQGAASNDLPMNNFRHTGVGNASARDEYAVVGQIQDSSYVFKAAGGSADAITASFAPAVTALVDGMRLYVRASASNTTTTPTFAPNGLTAHTITKFGGGALQAGDIKSGAVIALSYNLANTRWDFLNPAFGSFANVPWAVAAGTADAITATYAPPNGSLTDGLLLSFRASGPNTTTTPTFAPDGLTAHVITKFGGSALAVGDLPAALAESLIRYNLANTRWELINPTAVITYHSQLITASGNFTIPATAKASTVFKFTGTGGGGASGGTSTNNGAATVGGSAAGTFIAALSGFTPSTNVAVVIGAKGVKGAIGADGTDGGDTTIAYAAVVVGTATGGLHSGAITSGAAVSYSGPFGSTATVAVGASGLTLQQAILLAGGDGGNAVAGGATAVSGDGGASYWGPGSRGCGQDVAFPVAAKNYGSGGGGAPRQGGTDSTGADGAVGVVLVEWWL